MLPKFIIRLATKIGSQWPKNFFKKQWCGRLKIPFCLGSLSIFTLCLFYDQPDTFPVWSCCLRCLLGLLFCPFSTIKCLRIFGSTTETVKNCDDYFEILQGLGRPQATINITFASSAFACSLFPAFWQTCTHARDCPWPDLASLGILHLEGLIGGADLRAKSQYSG